MRNRLQKIIQKISKIAVFLLILRNYDRNEEKRRSYNL